MALNLELNRLRGYAIILVLLRHLPLPDIHYEYYDNFLLRLYSRLVHALLGFWGGVDLFFVISGYIILKTIMAQLNTLQHTHSKIYRNSFLKSFYVRRIFRIIPVGLFVYFVILCRAYFLYPSDTHLHTILDAALPLLTFSFNFYSAFIQGVPPEVGPYWTLSIEEQFYLLLPLFMIFVSSNRSRVWILLFVLFMLSFYIRPFYVEYRSLFYDIRYLTQVHCDGLFYGCLVYFLTQLPKVRDFFVANDKHKFEKILVTTFLVLFIGAVPSFYETTLSLIIPLICIASSILVLLAAVEKNIIIQYSYPQKFLDYIGIRSYSLYLIHQPVFTTFDLYISRHAYIANSPWLMAAGLTLSLIIAIWFSDLMYRYIEIPFIRKGKVISAKILAEGKKS